MNTELTYRYENANGVFVEHSVVLRGNIPMAETALLSCCEGGKQFIANQVGLPDLQFSVTAVPDKPKPRWHQICHVSSTNKPPTIELNMDLSSVIENFQNAQDAGWPASVGIAVGELF